MKIHIFSQGLEVLEFAEEELPSPEEMGQRVQENLVLMGLEPWPSVELEVLTYKSGSLVFASPAKVYIPAILSVLAGEK